MSEEIQEYSHDNTPQKSTISKISNYYKNSFWGRMLNIFFFAFSLFVANGMFDKPLTAIFSCIIIIVIIIVWYKKGDYLNEKRYRIELSFFIIIFIGLGIHLYIKAINEKNEIQKVSTENTTLKNSNIILRDSIFHLTLLAETTKVSANQKSALAQKYFDVERKPHIDISIVEYILKKGIPISLIIKFENGNPKSPAYHFTCVTHCFVDTVTDKDSLEALAVLRQYENGNNTLVKETTLKKTLSDSLSENDFEYISKRPHFTLGAFSYYDESNKYHLLYFCYEHLNNNLHRNYFKYNTPR